MSHPPRSRRAVAYWLLACCALVFAMVVVGGITRLTHSGLSIVEWQPIVGTLPPLDAAQWEAAFAKYRATPEFKLRNHDMTLEGFKGIFWWEYFHRLLGRLIGVAFLVPLVYFVARGAVRGALAWKLGAIFLLGAAQGALGWYMVKSGLVDDPRVSSERLAAHLGLAFLIYAAMLYTAMTLLSPLRTASSDAARRRAGFLVGLVFLMVLSGALVAAIRAGYAYNTWPLMNGHWFPPEALAVEPWWGNFLHNMATVQFVHRTLGALVLVTVLIVWSRVRHEPPNARARRWSHALLLVGAAQFGLGIATLVNGVPLALAALHQAGAVALFTCALGVRHALREAPRLQR
ncbi:MAG TPA: COX15/CtaA family protein [Usitatibacter sp.]|nr:COX15/CtaA family protein [Usitatibacter sp.]